jgi:hypothetical protein
MMANRYGGNFVIVSSYRCFFFIFCDLLQYLSVKYSTRWMVQLPLRYLEMNQLGSACMFYWKV